MNIFVEVSRNLKEQIFGEGYCLVEQFTKGCVMTLRTNARARKWRSGHESGQASE